MSESMHSDDKEKAVGTPVAEVASDMQAWDRPDGELPRALKNRHIAMISVGGVIGVGLFVSTANSLRHGGPVGTFLAYLSMGGVVYAVMSALGEMICEFPVTGGHITLARRYSGDSLGFALGWNYWYYWAVCLPSEISAVAVLFNYWNVSISNAVWVVISIIIVMTINMMGTRVYGELEFLFASIKVLLIVGLIIMGIVIDCGGGPNHKPIGFQYWRNPGPFVQYLNIEGRWGQFLGFWSVMINAAFGYVGSELTSMAAGETKNPSRNLPKAIRRVWIRCILFYVCGVFVAGLLVPSNDPSLNLSSNAAKSPWVIAAIRSGIPIIPHIINAGILTSAWSACSCQIYVSSRALYALAKNNQAPKIFQRTLKNGLPWAGVIVAGLIGLLAFMTVGNATAGTVFNYFSNITAVAGLQTWALIFITYLRFYKGCQVQGIDRNKFNYKARFQPYMSYVGLFFCIIVIFFNGWTFFTHGNWDTAGFITSYAPTPILAALFFIRKYKNKDVQIRYEDMDFSSYHHTLVAYTADPPPTNVFDRVWQWLM